MYKNIFFDFDGTVFDTVEGITKSVRYAINKVGLDAELNDLRCFAGPPLEDMFAEYFGFTHEQSVQAVAHFRERYTPIGLYECRVFPGLRELLTGLREAGLKVAIATSKPQFLAETLLKREGMFELFDVIEGTKLDGHNDSKADVLMRAMNALGAAPENSVLIGDTKWDVLGAKKCGVDCIGVEWGYAAEGDMEKAGVKEMCASSEELLKRLTDY